MEGEWSQEEEIRLLYTQVLDSDQVLYALSLLQAVLSVQPHTIIPSLSISLVNLASYGGSTIPSVDRSQKSLLEVILLSLTAFIRSEYPPTLDVTPANVVENLRVKSTAVEMVGFLMLQFSVILSSTESPVVTAGSGGRTSDRGLVHNPSYVSALVTLCDVQKVLLLSLKQVVRSRRESSGTSQKTLEKLKGAAPVINGNGQTDTLTSVDGSVKRPFDVAQISCVPLQVMFVNLLRALHNLICLEAQCVPSSPAPITPGRHTKRSLSSTLIQSGLGTAAQPFFQSLVVDTLSNSTLCDLHQHLLHMFSATLPHLSAQLDDLAPKILRQLCRNLENTVAESATNTRSSEGEGPRDMRDTPRCGGGGMVVVGNVQALVNIVLCCLFGGFPPESVSLRHCSLNRFWDAGCASRSEESEVVVSPTSKQPSTMSWLFGVFAGQSKPAAASPVGARSPKLGLSHGRVGQSIRLLLPAVYNALTEVWTWLKGRAGPVVDGRVVSGGNDRGSDGGMGKSVRGGGSSIESEKRRAEYEVSQQRHVCFLPRHVLSIMCLQLLCHYNFTDVCIDVRLL